MINETPRRVQYHKLHHASIPTYLEPENQTPAIRHLEIRDLPLHEFPPALSRRLPSCRNSGINRRRHTKISSRALHRRIGNLIRSTFEQDTLDTASLAPKNCQIAALGCHPSDEGGTYSKRGAGLPDKSSVCTPVNMAPKTDILSTYPRAKPMSLGREVLPIRVRFSHLAVSDSWPLVGDS